VNIKRSQLFLGLLAILGLALIIVMIRYLTLSMDISREVPSPSDHPMPAPWPRTVSMPKFPWPSPAASAEHQIRNKWVSEGNQTTLLDVAARLETALEVAGFETWKYSGVPNGFALVTQSFCSLHLVATPPTIQSYWVRRGWFFCEIPKLGATNTFLTIGRVHFSSPQLEASHGIEQG
jgi:hypothetical protein